MYLVIVTKKCRWFLLVLLLIFTFDIDAQFYGGADVSYLNQMIDCGGQYRVDGNKVDPFEALANKGMKLARVRLWHNPTWTDYSDLTDVIKTLERCKQVNVPTLLDFHYSDTWAHPGQQLVPEAWKGLSDNLLMDSLYNYTFGVLQRLDSLDLRPKMVQIGNETNTEMLVLEKRPEKSNINWVRNAKILNTGIRAVKDFNIQMQADVEIMIHIAQPENAKWWVKEALEADVQNFDWIGISYYPKWSEMNLAELGKTIKQLKSFTRKEVMVVETAYPYTLDHFDNAHNLLGTDALLPDFPATRRGQTDFLSALVKEIRNNGGRGLIYWEPGWISTNCSTQWGVGSHWENAILFDAADGNNMLPSADFMK